MKRRDFETLAKRSLEGVPGLVFKGDLTVCCPVGDVLRGLCFEGSSFDKGAFYVSVFMLPLWVPTEHIHFNFGDRLRESTGSDRWDADSPNLTAELGAIARDAIFSVRDIASPQGFLKAMESLDRMWDPYAQQAMAFTWARIGNVPNAKKGIEALMSNLDKTFAWQREMAERAGSFGEMLVRDLGEAQEQLAVWQSQSIQNLKLSKYIEHA